MATEWFVVGAMCAPLLIILLYQHPRFAFVVALLGLLLPLTQVQAETRPFAVLAVVAQVARLGSGRGQAVLNEQIRGLAPLAVLVILFASSLAWSEDRRRTILGCAAWAVLLCGVWAFRRVLGPAEMRHILFITLLAVMAANVVLAALGSPGAFAGGRAIGLMGNANGLGVLCGLTLPLILMAKQPTVRILGSVSIVYLLALSSSRAGALAALIGATTVLFLRSSTTVRALLVPVFFAAAWLIWSVDWEAFVQQDSGLLRSNDSRSEVWANSIVEFRRKPLIGTGFASQDGLGSSYLKLAAELGTLGIGVAIVALYRLIAPSVVEPAGFAVAMAGLANAAFEGWLLAAGSFYCFTFFAIIVTATPARHGDVSQLKGVAR